jgi:hypothetical protein
VQTFGKTSGVVARSTAASHLNVGRELISILLD